MTLFDAYELAAEIARIPSAHRFELLRTVDSRGMGYTCRIYTLDDCRLVAGASKGSNAASVVRAARREAGLA
jgi:hypothetical protein